MGGPEGQGQAATPQLSFPTSCSPSCLRPLGGGGFWEQPRGTSRQGQGAHVGRLRGRGRGSGHAAVPLVRWGPGKPEPASRTLVSHGLAL